MERDRAGVAREPAFMNMHSPARPNADELRRVLFLQGPPSCFWMELADTFERDGHAVFRINLCTADLVYWRRRGADHYRGGFDGWRAHLRAYLQRRRITDILLYADRLPYHVVASELGEELGVRVNVVEFGYLRPGWLTLERCGMGAFSRFPDRPEDIRGIAAVARASGARFDETPRHAHGFLREAANEVAFNLLNSLFAWPYPRFRMDRAPHPLIDFVSWLPKLFGQSRRAEEAARIAAAHAEEGVRYGLVALQLQSDYQIRDNSHFAGLEEMIEQVVASFAAHAPRDRRLLFKTHPLDNGLIDWRAIARCAAARGGADGRVKVIDGGDLETLIRGADGVIAVNSTVGLHAIRAGTPTLLLGKAVFDVEGLAHQGALDDFWTAPEPVDTALADDLVEALAASIQVRGSFYEREGRAAACRDIVRRISTGLVNEPGAFLPSPPRLPVAPRASRPAESLGPRVPVRTGSPG